MTTLHRLRKIQRQALILCELLEQDNLPQTAEFDVIIVHAEIVAHLLSKECNKFVGLTPKKQPNIDNKHECKLK